MLMAHCRRCQAEIVDYSAVVDLGGDIFCCRNCLVASRGGHTAIVPELPLCAHCACPLVEPDSLVERQARWFCCYNCLVADVRPARLLAA